MNKTLFLYINSFAGKNKFLDIIFIFLAKASPYAFILYEIYLYFYKKRKYEAIYAFYAATLGIFISKIISTFYFHNRPFMDKIGKLLIYHSPDSSFPSDHATFMFSLAFSFYFFNVPYKKFFLILAILGSLARIYVGVHYPFDILGGFIVGLLSAYIIYRFQDKLKNLNNFILKLEENIFSKIFIR